MGPEADLPNSGGFSDNFPPLFDGNCDYSSYREDIYLCVNLTTLPVINPLSGNHGMFRRRRKNGSQNIWTDIICREGSVGLIIERLDKANAIDIINQLENDLADFLDYSCNKTVSVEYVISGFRTRVDRVSSLILEEKLKGNLLLRQAQLADHDIQLVIGASSGR